MELKEYLTELKLGHGIPQPVTYGLLYIPVSDSFVHLASGLRISQFERVGGTGNLVKLSGDASGYKALHLLHPNADFCFFRLTNGNQVRFTQQEGKAS